MVRGWFRRARNNLVYEIWQTRFTVRNNFFGYRLRDSDVQGPVLRTLGPWPSGHANESVVSLGHRPHTMRRRKLVLRDTELMSVRDPYTRMSSPRETGDYDATSAVRPADPTSFQCHNSALKWSHCGYCVPRTFCVTIVEDRTPPFRW